MEVREPDFDWGGPWTEKKLNAFTKYVRAYLKIMKNYSYWQTIYFDGFAGSGERKTKGTKGLLRELEITAEEENIYQGAAERVIQLTQPYEFDWYYFIEKDQKNLEKLKEKLLSSDEGKKKEEKLQFRSGNCNEELKKLAKALRSRKFAALLFLDPFGMQIEWEAISGLKNTRSDIWILVPTGVIINRLLDRQGKLRNIKKLESFFGLSEAEVRDKFYEATGQVSLFEDNDEHYQKVFNPIEKIAKIYVSNLKKVWKFVTDPPLTLDNRKGTPLFHFVFASNNANALKIANYIIKNP